MATAKKAVPMCVVSIGYRDYLMPVTAGMKLVELMSSAVECERQFDPRRFEIGEQPLVQLEVVKASQISRPSPLGAADAGLMLENNPTPVSRFR